MAPVRNLQNFMAHVLTFCAWLLLPALSAYTIFCKFSRCILDIHEGVEKLFKYVKSIKRLGSIRDSVYDLLSNSRLFCSKVSLGKNYKYIRPSACG